MIILKINSSTYWSNCCCWNVSYRKVIFT